MQICTKIRINSIFLRKKCTFICVSAKFVVPLQRILIEYSQLYCGFLIKIRKYNADI